MLGWRSKRKPPAGREYFERGFNWSRLKYEKTLKSGHSITRG
jgi:hypothetical protein